MTRTLKYVDPLVRDPVLKNIKAAVFSCVKTHEIRCEISNIRHGIKICFRIKIFYCNIDSVLKLMQMTIMNIFT